MRPRTRDLNHPASVALVLKQLTHLPVAALTLLTATAYAQHPDSLKVAAGVNIFAWLAQFYGHGIHERRAPAVLDNLLGGESPPYLRCESEYDDPLNSVGPRPAFRAL